MERIAVIMTCHNRKDKTLCCLRQLFKTNRRNTTKMSIFLTDDGCTDGTIEAILQEFSGKDIHILSGTGSLFWAGGMRNSWRTALKFNYDGYLLLNDDTYVFEFLFEELFSMHQYSLTNYNKSGIYCGITCNSSITEMTYGGSVILNKILNTSKRLNPNGKYQRCDLGNANIMFVTSEIIEKIGIFNEKYTHAIADYDYTLIAKKRNIPILLSSRFCGICENNNTNTYDVFKKKKIFERIKFLYSPKGLAFSNQLYYMKRHFPYRYLMVFFIGWAKVLLPSLYLKLDNRKCFFKI